MKKNIYPRWLVFSFLFLFSSVWTWGQKDISFDVSKGNVRFTDGSYSGKDSEGNEVEGVHNPENHYIISGITENYNVQVGAENALVTKNFIIYLNGVDIRSKGNQVCAFSVWNQENSIVAVILKKGSQNKLYSGMNRAGLEKSGGESGTGTLLITCEEGYSAWVADHTKGHTQGVYNESACDKDCGHLDARSGNVWTGGGAQHYHAGAGIGTRGEGTGGSDKAGEIKGTNALVNLTIAGGNIKAMGALGTGTNSSGGAAAIGTGCALDRDCIAGTITGLNITGGHIIAYRIDNSAACIGGGYRSGYVNMSIYGGTIDAMQTYQVPGKAHEFKHMRAAAIGGGGGGSSTASEAGATVTIHNGTISAMGQYGSAIGSGSGGDAGYGQDAKVIIYSGYIEAITEKGAGEGAGAAIGSGGSTGTGHAGNATVEIKGGQIVANSELGADIGGGGTNSARTQGYGGKGIVTISGGTITAENGGIGGGRANAGVGGDSEITISGEHTDISAASIGGGTSKTNTGGNVKLTVSAGKLTVSDFIGGGIGGKNKDLLGWAKVYIKGGEISGRILMSASKSGGCVFNMTGGTLTSPITDKPGGAVYMIDPKGVATMSGGTISNCTGTNGGAIYMSGGTFGISGGTISNCTGTNGGAVYMEGGTFDISGGNISHCAGTNGGALYMANGTFAISGTANMQNNDATNGGAVYLAGTGAFNVNGGSIQQNRVTQHGGAIYLNEGTFAMTDGKITDNESTAGDGAGIYILKGTVSVSGGEVRENIAASGKGGGFYVSGGEVALTNGEIVANKAAKAGGGIYCQGNSISVNGCTVTENEATAGNGGGIFLSDGASMVYNGGLLTYNKASGSGDFKTAYKNKGDDISGVGGGIYISTGSSLTFDGIERLGIYANTAAMAADDVFANGDGTKLVLPNISHMSLASYAGNAEGLGWYEDYFVADENYSQTNVARGEYDTFEKRFKEAQKTGQNLREFNYENEQTKTFENTYVAFALGFLFSDLIIEVEGLYSGESCIFSVQGTAQGGIYQYQVPIHGSSGKSVRQRITKLPVDVYTVTLMKEWPWAYQDVDPIERLNTDIYKFTLQHKSTPPITHDEEFVKVKLE